MKKSGKKFVAAKDTKKKTGTRKKRRNTLSLKDGIRAALIAAGLIGVTALVTVSLILADSVTGEDTEEAPYITEALPEEEISPPENPFAESLPEKELAAPQKEQEEPVKLPEAKPKHEPEVPSAKPVDENPIETKPPVAIPLHRGTITLVMDDAGNNLHELDAFLAFRGHITIAVLPGLPHSAEAARRVRAAGKELILHQPMEALGGQNPGPGAIYTSMTDEEIRSIVEKNLAEVGPVAGMNNHQGSKVTMDERVMEIILSICHDQGIYFLDSRTTADTAVPLVAERERMKIWERDVFLDNIQERAAMIRSFHEGLQKAEKKGGAIMIGHVWSSELAAVLEELYPELVEQGFSLSTISKIMMGTLDYEDSWD